MSAQTLSQYRLYCNTESSYVQTDYRFDLPTTCPNDNNHSIDTTTITISSSYRPNTVINEDAVATGRNDFQTRGLKLDIPASIGEHYIPFTSPETDLELMLFEVGSDASNIGDTYSLIVMPFTVCGVFTQNASIGETILNVNSTVFLYIKDGIVLYDINNVKLGYCRDLDPNTGTLSLVMPLEVNITAGDPVKFGFPRATNISIFQAGIKKFGERANNLASFPKDTPVGLFYTNVNGTSKSLYISFDYYF